MKYTNHIPEVNNLPFDTKFQSTEGYEEKDINEILKELDFFTYSVDEVIQVFEEDNLNNRVIRKAGEDLNIIDVNRMAVDLAIEVYSRMEKINKSLKGVRPKLLNEDHAQVTLNKLKLMQNKDIPTLLELRTGLNTFDLESTLIAYNFSTFLRDIDSKEELNHEDFFNLSMYTSVLSERIYVIFNDVIPKIIRMNEDKVTPFKDFILDEYYLTEVGEKSMAQFEILVENEGYRMKHPDNLDGTGWLSTKDFNRIFNDSDVDIELAKSLIDEMIDSTVGRVYLCSGTVEGEQSYLLLPQIALEHISKGDVIRCSQSFYALTHCDKLTLNEGFKEDMKSVDIYEDGDILKEFDELGLISMYNPIQIAFSPYVNKLYTV